MRPVALERDELQKIGGELQTAADCNVVSMLSLRRSEFRKERMKLALLIAAVLAASGASAQQFKAPVTSLGPADAALLVTSEPELFKSATVLAAQRPAVQREIAELELESTSRNSPFKEPSTSRFTKLPGGLLYFQHAVPSTLTSVPPLYESGIDVYGMGIVMYWNSRIPYDQGIIAVAPAAVAVTKGRLFGTDPFTLQVTFPEGDTDTTECTVAERIPASQVHPALTGTGTVFTCSGAMDVVSQHWYFEDYAQYITKDVRDEDGYLSQFKVTGVKFR